jgi:CelD/BcsL family acetyltransferase involved in cellulose biosynthesis
LTSPLVRNAGPAAAATRRFPFGRLPVHATHAFHRASALPLPSDAARRAEPRAGGIATEIVDAAAFAALGQAWRDLVGAAAETNVFMEPAVLVAAQAAEPGTPIKVLLAWRSAPSGRELAGRELAGAWAFAVTGGLVPRLQAPAAPLAALASPVVRADCIEPVLESFFAALAASPLPKILELKAMPDEGPIRDALGRVVARRRCDNIVEERRRRAVLRSDLDGSAYLELSVSGSRRRKLRQLRSRLGRQGEVSYRRATDPEAVAVATEDFLALEARGWKGRRGTALASDRRLADFTREAVTGLAKDGLASVSWLALDGRPVSMGVVLRSGATASTWKIAYDEEAAPFSPGYLLALEDTAAFLADPAIAEVDSCASAEFGIMAEVWRERRAVADVHLDVRPGPSLRFRAAMLLLATADLLPRIRRRLRAREQLRRFYYRVRRLRP